MKKIVFFSIFFFLFSIGLFAMAQDVPPPGPPPPPGDDIPIDDHLPILLVAGILIGGYYIYKTRLKIAG